MLTPRLNCIIGHISAKRIADIGTDHAYIPIALAQQNKLSYAFACDIREGPLAIAKSNIRKNGLESIIETRLGSGLSTLLPGEAEEIIIAGMGGILIGEILAEHEEIAKRASKLILQPMNAQEELRKFLIRRGYCISHEDIVLEGFKVYTVFDAQNGAQKPFSKEIDYSVPPSLYNHPYIANLIHKKKREFTKIKLGLSHSTTPDKKKLEKYTLLLEQLTQIEQEVLIK